MDDRRCGDAVQCAQTGLSMWLGINEAWTTMRKHEAGPSATRRYDANYGNFQTDLYGEIRREAYGDDIGQNSWLTADEHDKFLEWLELSTGKKLLDVACGAGGP